MDLDASLGVLDSKVDSFKGGLTFAKKSWLAVQYRAGSAIQGLFEIKDTHRPRALRQG